MISPNTVAELSRVVEHLAHLECTAMDSTCRKELIRAQIVALRLLRNELKGAIALRKLAQEASLA